MKRITRLLETWAEIAGVDLVGVGRWGHAEGYVVGSERLPVVRAPDFVCTTGLDDYAGVSEAWWCDDHFSLTLWRWDDFRGSWRRISSSRHLPQLDIGLILRCVEAPTQLTAIGHLRDSFRARLGINYSP